MLLNHKSTNEILEERIDEEVFVITSDEEFDRIWDEADTEIEDTWDEEHWGEVREEWY